MTTADAPLISARDWSEIFAARQRDALEAALTAYLPTRRWFGGKSRTISSINVRDVVELSRDKRLAMLDVEFHEGEPVSYQLPLAIANVRREQEQARAVPVIARLKDGAVLYEPVQDEDFATGLLDTIAKKKVLRGKRGSITAAPTRAFKELRGTETLSSHVLGVEQSNTAIIYGERLFLKLFRKLETGINTDFELTRFLNEETSFRHTPRVAGTLEYSDAKSGAPTTVAILQGFTQNSGDAWAYTLDSLGRYFDRLLSDSTMVERISKSMPDESLFELARHPLPDLARDVIGSYLNDAALLGRRTAEMHMALASRDDIPAFAPEPFTPHYQRSIYQYMRTQVVQTLQLVRKQGKARPEYAQLLEQETMLHDRVRRVLEGKIDARRIRIHGDYHLGQVLYTGNDFIIIDFEGEPARPLSERRLKRSALRDVAGMLRSFHYAPHAVIFGAAPGSYVREEDLERLEIGSQFWHQWVSATYLRAYLEASAEATHLPSSPASVEVLLSAYLIEKALYEISYELNNRPDWVGIPLRGVLDLLG